MKACQDTFSDSLNESLPSITAVFSIVIEHERQNGLSHVQEESTPLVNVVDGKTLLQPFLRPNSSFLTFIKHQLLGGGGNTDYIEYRFTFH